MGSRMMASSLRGRRPETIFLLPANRLISAALKDECSMTKTINYGQLMHKAALSMLADVLSQVAREGLPGKHHFYITFDTTHPGVDMSPSLRARYPKEMMIVLQEWFQDLAVMKDRFTVTLNFGNVPEPIVVPFDALKSFIDPSVEFGLSFRAKAEGASDDASEDLTDPDRLEAALSHGRTPTSLKSVEGEVVSLDKFRKQ